MIDQQLQSKIQKCIQLNIQHMEKTIQNKMIFMYLKQRKKQNDITHFSINNKTGVIKLIFKDHKKALQFYEQNNFKDRILLRCFNIYFNLTVSKNQLQKYFFQGLNQSNQRGLFQSASRFGICKIYTSYGTNALVNMRAKLKPTGVISLIRKQPLTQIQFTQLQNNLAKIGIKLSQYQPQEGLHLSLNLFNFIGNQYVKQDQCKLHEIAKQNAKNILIKYNLDQPVHSSFIIKKKQANQIRTQVTIFSSAFFQFSNNESTIHNFQKIRIQSIKDPLISVKLFFHNEEANSYYSLFTKNLKKSNQSMSNKQFQNILLQDCRKINKNALQFLVFPQKAGTYIGRLYFNSQEEGKIFVVNYQRFRYILGQHFINKQVVFNINIDEKTYKKIKMAQKRVTQQQSNIKNYSQITKKQKKSSNQYPIAPPNMPPLNFGILQQPLCQTGYPQQVISNQFLPSIPTKGYIGMPSSIPIRIAGKPSAILPGMSLVIPPEMPSVVPSGQNETSQVKLNMNSGNQQTNLKVQLKQILSDKRRLLQIDSKQAKKFLFKHIVHVIEENKQILEIKDTNNQANNFLNNTNVYQILQFLENPRNNLALFKRKSHE